MATSISINPLHIANDRIDRESKSVAPHITMESSGGRKGSFDRCMGKITKEIMMSSFLAGTSIATGNYFGILALNKLGVDTTKFIYDFQASGCQSTTTVSTLTDTYKQRNSYSATFLQYPIVYSVALTSVACLGLMLLGRNQQSALLKAQQKLSEVEASRNSSKPLENNNAVESKTAEGLSEVNKKETTGKMRSLPNSCGNVVDKIVNFPVLRNYVLFPHVIVTFTLTTLVEYLKRPVTCLGICATVKGLTTACENWRSSTCNDDCINANITERLVILSALTVGTMALSYFFAIKPYFHLKKQTKEVEQRIAAINLIESQQKTHNAKSANENMPATWVDLGQRIAHEEQILERKNLDQARQALEQEKQKLKQEKQELEQLRIQATLPTSTETVTVHTGDDEPTNAVELTSIAIMNAPSA